jgi:hypothetical protein
MAGKAGAAGASDGVEREVKREGMEELALAGGAEIR